MYDDLTDLVTGSTCLGCSRAGRLLCVDCLIGLPSTAQPMWPTPCPPGLVTPWATGPYAGLVRDLVLGHKERGLLALAGPLGLLLAEAVAAAVPSPCTVVLVPVPSRRASVRARGHDPTYETTRSAARHLRAVGYDAVPHRLLAIRGALLDQAGLTSEQRAANLAGSFWCPAAAVGALARTRRRARAVICDDVLTTGATTREAQRALESVGIQPAAIAVVAATRRRLLRLHSHSSDSSLVMRRATD
jgi:predicted amidophosphoribosyltransferase